MSIKWEKTATGNWNGNGNTCDFHTTKGTGRTFRIPNIAPTDQAYELQIFKTNAKGELKVNFRYFPTIKDAKQFAEMVDAENFLL